MRTLCCLVLLIGFIIICQGKTQSVKQDITVDNQQRYYLIYAPPTKDKTAARPLVFVFHGGGGTADRMDRFTGFNELADKHNFIVVYPNGLNKHWNDGRKSQFYTKQDKEVDDVQFIKAILKKVEKEYAIDPKQIFATGTSNGGFFCQRLAVEMSDTFAAVASVISQLPLPLSEKDQFKPSSPISVMLMNGTKDPLVPYDGGDVTVVLFPRLQKFVKPKSRGKALSTDKTIDLWLKHNGIASKPLVTEIEDKDKTDNCSCTVYQWHNKQNKRTVVLYKIVGGGHTYPGGVQYLPKRLIGETCRDFDASEEVWKFFQLNKKL